MSRSHSTHSGDESRGRFGRWSGDNILWIVVPGIFTLVVVGMLCAATHNFLWLALLPVGVGVPYYVLVRFVEGKPKGNLMHTIQAQLDEAATRIAMDRFEPYRHPLLPRVEVPAARRTKPPSLWVYDNILVSGDLGTNGVVAIGFKVDCEAMEQATSTAKDRFEDTLNMFLNRLTPPMRMQVVWMVSNDYRRELESYAAVKCQTKIAEVIRARRAEELSKRMADRLLRREQCYIFLSMKLDNDLGVFVFNRKKHRHIHRELWLELMGFFAHWEQLARDILGQAHVRLTRLDNQGFIDVAHHVINPDEVRMGIAAALYDPRWTLQEHVFHSDVVRLDDGMLRMGNLYHSVLTMTRLPQSVAVGVINPLLKNRLQDYTVSCNVIVHDRQEEIRKTEAQLERLIGDFARQPSIVSLKHEIARKEQKVQELAAGYKFPFELEYIIRAWDADRDRLRQKINALKAAVAQTGGAQCYEETKVAKTFFFQSLPGWPWGTDSSRRLYAETPVVSCLLPISSSFEGLLDGAEALYESATGSLVGLKTFVGGVPQNAVVVGDVRVGKSGTINELLLQSDPFYSFTAIVDEGASYLELVRLAGCQPIVVTSDGNLTINPFQLEGLPYTASQLNAAKGITAQLIGIMNDEEKQARREAQIGYVLQDVYRDFYESWKRHDAESHHRLEVMAAAFSGWRARQIWRDEGLLEQFREYQDYWEGSARAREAAELLDLGELNRLRQQDDFRELVFRLAYAFMPPGDQPQLSHVVEGMRVADPTHVPIHEMKDLALQLAAWQADGDHGVLVDGVSNVSLKQPYVYFELGSIPESDTRLKQIMTFLQINQLRNHIIAMPRRLRKRVVIEEARRVLGSRHGEALVSEFYAQMPKFGCWICSVTQQFDTFMRSSIRPVVMGNSSIFLLLRQRDHDDVKNLTHHLKLSESMGQAVEGFPSPSAMTGEKFSMFAYVHRLPLADKMGVCVNRLSKEALWIAGSNNEEVGAKRDLIKVNSGDVWKSLEAAAA